MKAILLVRVSTDDQELEEQKNNLTAYAISQGYNEEDLITIENKESAINLTEDERNGLNKMKEYIANDPTINCVYIWELSRLTRIPTTGYSLREFFKKNKIQLKNYKPVFSLLNDSLSDYDDNGSILFALYMTFAEAEMKNKKAQFKRSKLRNARLGKFSGGFVKFGYFIDKEGYYQISNKKIEGTDLNEADLIRYIFNRYEKGISIFKLTKELMDRGYVKTQNLVRNILISEEYTGKYTGEFVSDSIKEKDQKFERIYPQIISREQFLKCKEIAKNNNKKADKTNEIYLAHGLIKCVECGTTYIGMKSSIQYLCYGRYGKEAKFNKEDACKKSPSININILDTILWQATKGLELKYRTENLKKYIDELNDKIRINNEKINSLRKNIVDVQAEMERITNSYNKGRISEEKSDKEHNECEKKVRQHNNEISKLESENLSLNSIIDESSESLSIKDIRKINDDIYAENNLLEKQKVIKRHVDYINIINEELNHTRLVKIYFYIYKNPMVYRVHYNKKPQLIETAIGGIFANEPYRFTKVGFEIEKRFIRRNDKTISINKNL